MTSCSQLGDIDSLAAGELDAPHAALLRAHAADCGECRDELDLATAERSLFARRAHAMPPPPAALGVAIHEHLDPSLVRSLRTNPGRVASGFVRMLRRGHVTAACAAALFMVAAFSRPGAGTEVPRSRQGVDLQSSVSTDGEIATSGMLASIGAEEPLACSSGGSAVAGAASIAPSDFGATFTSSSSSSSSSASLERVLACGTSSRSWAGCEPSVTCSALRQ